MKTDRNRKNKDNENEEKNGTKMIMTSGVEAIKK